jgi:large subunit ribosomal protein L23
MQCLDIYDVLLGTYVTEKTVRVLELNQLTFRVSGAASKYDIKRSVEFLFNLKVSAVSVINVKKKELKKNMNKLCYRKKWKKAVVSVYNASF